MSLKIVFLGNPTIAASTLEAMLDAGYKIVAVISNPPKKQGRSQIKQPSPVEKLAQKKGLKLINPPNLNDPSCMQTLAKLNADLFYIVAYGKILKPAILELPKYGCYNLHYSLLPKWRGATPVQSALLHGDKKTGVTIFRLVSRMDAGDMLASSSCEINSGITADELFAKLSTLGAELSLKWLDKIPTAKLTPQIEQNASYCTKFTTDDFKLDFINSASEIYRRWQAFPNQVYSEFSGYRLKFLKLALTAKKITQAPGYAYFEEGQFYINTSQGAIKVLECQLAGKKKLLAADFVRGLSPQLKKALQG